MTTFLLQHLKLLKKEQFKVIRPIFPKYEAKRVQTNISTAMAAAIMPKMAALIVQVLDWIVGRLVDGVTVGVVGRREGDRVGLVG